MNAPGCFLLLLSSLLSAAALHAETPRTPSARRGQVGVTAPVAAAVPRPAPVLPPLPAGIEELKFGDLFKIPVGPRGLELTEKVRALDGRRVRVLGYMVREETANCDTCLPPGAVAPSRKPSWVENVMPGRVLLTRTPQTVSMSHYGLCDDLPPQTVFITVPDRFGELVPFTPGLLLLTGTLSVGPRAEPDGRRSIVRLTLDPPATAGGSHPSSMSAAALPVASAAVPNQTTPLSHP